MDFLTVEFFTALLSIIVIDLVLAGDNAIVIGLAARNLAKEHQKKAIFWGTFGAIAIRAVLTLFVVKLLDIPWLLAIGGILLIGIAYKLLAEEKSHDIKESANLWGAIKTIIIADAVMGLDNVLAVAGAAHGSFLLVILGLLISVPIVVWGSTVILKLIERFPSIIYIGSGVLAWTSAKMIMHEPHLKGFFEQTAGMTILFPLVLIAGVLLAGWLKNKQKKSS